MQPESQEYKGHHIQLLKSTGAREGARDDPGELLIDDAPVAYGQLPDGLYYLHEYAYDWTDNLITLARNFIDYREATT